METSYRDASWCSVLSNCYQSKLLRSIKNGSDLKFDNLFRMKVDEEVPVLLKSLSHQWIQEKKKPRPSLVRALCRSFGCSFVAISLFAVFLSNPRLWLLRYLPSILFWSRPISVLSTTSMREYLPQLCFCV